MKYIYTTLIISLLMFSKPLISQISYETSKAVLIYQFAKNISHKNEKEIKKYKICFLGNDFETYQELKKIVINNKIKGKSVELSAINSLNKLPDVQILYIDKNWSKKVEEVWYKIETKNILLVTEQCSDAKYVMLNILYKPGQKSISFEINKANIIIENLSFNQELLLFGGKEVDIRELYKNIKQQLEKEKQDIVQYKELIKKQTEELQTLHKQTEKLNTDIGNLLEKISKSEGKLNNLADSLKSQQIKLSEKLSQIKTQEIKLKTQEQEIGLKKEEIESGTIELNNIIAKKNKQQLIIDSQKITLSDKEAIIDARNKQLTIFAMFAFMLIILIIAIFYAFRTRKKANEKLIIINKEIESKKQILEKTLKKLTKTQSQLVQSEKMASLGVLTAGVAHEINNPVNYINSGLEGLKTVSAQIVNLISKYLKNTGENKKIDKQNMHEELEFLTNGINTLTKNIQTGVNRTSEIIKSLNTFSRIDKDELTLTDIHENLDSTITLLYNKYKNRIKIIKNYSKIPKIYSYSGKLNQVFMNIISNAVQAIKGKGIITITTSFDKRDTENNKYIKICIKDTGTGIAEENEDKIFEPFFTTKDVGDGTGLGLSITHGIIKQHNGKINFTSSSEKGTEFKLYLPIILENK